MFWGTRLKILHMAKSAHLGFHLVSAISTPQIAPFLWTSCLNSLRLSIPHSYDGIHNSSIRQMFAELVPGPVLGLASPQWMSRLLMACLLVQASEEEAACCLYMISRAFSFLRIHSRFLPKQTRQVIDHYLQWILRKLRSRPESRASYTIGRASAKGPFL